MNSVAKVQPVTNYEHSSASRRSLFPSASTDSEDSDIGPMSPLSYDSSDGEKCLAIGDYHILGVVENTDEGNTPDKVKTCASDTMSPLILSPGGSKSKKVVPENTLSGTPCKGSPSFSLKTPHDTSSVKPKLPKLIRDTANKRKLSVTSPVESKQVKLDSSSRVRTTLFPEADIALPTKKFYSSTENVMDGIRNKKKVVPEPNVSFASHRKRIRPRKVLGGINAGVRHKIRKPKRKKIKFIRGGMNETEKKAINSYLEDLKHMRSNSNENSTKLIDNKENRVPVEPQPKLIIMPPKLQKFESNSLPDLVRNANPVSQKRPSSPIENEPLPNRKFFKFSRATRSSANRVQSDNRKTCLLDKNHVQPPKQSLIFDTSDFATKEDSDMPKADIDNLLSSLDEDIGCAISNKITLQAHNSVVASENSILLHHEPSRNANLILSPISQMCDFTSGLALNSPIRAKNLTEVLNNMSSNTNPKNVSNDTSEKQKLFPIFSNPNCGITPKKDQTVAPADKKFKKISQDQMLLDAGQKRWGVTQCVECQFVYHIGDPSDENLHVSYHEAAHILRFSGWKNERVVADFNSKERIIKIVPGDSKLWWKRAVELMELINRDLGCYEMEFKLDECQIYLYIKNKAIVGCLVAVAKTEGHRMLTTADNQADVCSERKYAIKCGISRIWVSHNFRKQGVASALVDALKKNFYLGSILTNDDIALSPPTEMGKQFAKKYFKTASYLVYFI